MNFHKKQFLLNDKSATSKRAKWVSYSNYCSLIADDCLLSTKSYLRSMQHKYTNHLIHETSPYLLQHAHNPVNWYPWSEEALQKAKTENKPILVSIGYAACHWCHVMERESFENEAVAALMNEFFINIKVDREERPDLDHVYMDAVQAIAGNGGWPLNVFLTPDRKPFYGGTYFPPKPMYNRASWQQVIEAIHQSYEEKPDEIQQQANNLIEHLLNANNIGAKKKIDEGLYTPDSLSTIAENILQSADTVWGGFGHAPKFPQTLSIQYLLRHYYFTGDEAAIKQALLSIDKMLKGGIYDQLGGGLARYSTDEEWLAPHFEKMLYDNALLLNVLSEAFQLTKEARYEKAIAHIIAFVEREWLHPEGGIYSALDADSEGVEGKYYTWSKAEIEAILQEDAPLFCKIYDVTDGGNWEHTNILRLLSSISEAAKELGLQEEVLEQKMIECNNVLLSQREKRIKPLLDDKIIIGWNALLVKALCKAYAATGITHYLQLAEKNCSFIEEKFYKKENDRWFHTWKNDEAKYPAFLDDLSYLVQAYIHLQEVTGNTIYLTTAKMLTEYVIGNYSDEENVLFYYTPAFQTDIVIRKKETYDGATPSGNATMCHNLGYLSVIFDMPEWKERSLQMLSSLDKAIVRYPTSFGEWASTVQMAVYGLNEIAIIGAEFQDFLVKANHYYIPNKILMAANKENIHFPLLKDKTSSNNQTFIYLCKDYACLKPVQSVEALIDLVTEEGRQ